MLNHTPGPWKQGIVWETGSDATVGIYDKKTRLIADVYIRRTDEYIRHVGEQFLSCPPPEQGEANATLIAAAPELLGALKDLLPPPEEPGSDDWWCPVCKRWVPGTEVTYGEFHLACGTYLSDINTEQWLERARKAVAKAEGLEIDEKAKRGVESREE